jgi:plasmid stabilization system protein ParE
VTLTIGVAQHPRDAKDARDLIAAANAALAAAKEAGRNQVALPPTEDMVMKSCYYPAGSLRKLKILAERLSRKESRLLREALDDLLRKYDAPGNL